jgi:hypothetical protein
VLPRSYLFLDESGDTGPGAPHDPYARYLCLLGCALGRESYWSDVAPAFDAFKGEHFPAHRERPVLLHRDDILRRNGPFQVLKVLGHASAFDAGLLRLYGALPYVC